jgi:multidrug efflux pump subunit AcrA (membrane-fusion protein)
MSPRIPARVRRLVRSLVLAIVLALPAVSCSKTQTAQASDRQGSAKPVAAVAVQKDSIQRAVDVVGSLAAVDQVIISSEADGNVRAILADLGDRVKAGQVLIQLDDEKQQYTLDQQQAALARALAQYGAPDPQHLPDIEQTPDVQKAQADLLQATRALDRATELYKRTLVPQQTLDDAKTAAEGSKAGYNAALQNARNLRASIQASEATLKLAGRHLRDTAIRAPFDGYVEKRLVNLGELVKAQMPVMAIVRLDPLKVIAEIPERMAPWITVGRPVELRVDAYRDRTFTGKVTRISPAVNTATRAFPFEAVVPNVDAALKPGTFARVHIESGKVDQVLTLPHLALQYRYGVNRVFVINGNQLAMRELQVGERLGDRIEIVTGVKEGERVAITDVDTLADGALVAVTK